MIRYSKAKCILFFTIVIIICLWLRIRFRRHQDIDLGNIDGYEYGTVQYFVPKSSKKRDWHNYTQIKHEKKRVGIGEQGRPGKTATADWLDYKTGCNEALGNNISLHRSLPDVRYPECASRLYLASLPTVSVVIPFYDEILSTLLRTVHSVLNRSPPGLIKEIILVNDNGMEKYKNDSMSRELVRYVDGHLPKVKVLRMLARGGAAAARNAGARHATGQVLLVLDAHSEVNVNWLPPLLEPIAMDYRTVVVPSIDYISPESFAYLSRGVGSRGIFDWQLDYKRAPLLPEDLKNLPDPYETPVMQGGLFAISRAFFWELGGYDPGLLECVAEQFELSFKIWQCGGRILEAPCSRVGHLYRIREYSGINVARNYRRVAEVWMDEYAKFVYMRRPDYLSVNPGDLLVQKELRHWLQCKPFRWFLQEVAFEITDRYPVIEPVPFAQGRIRPLASPELCVDVYYGKETDPLELKECHDGDARQKFQFTWQRDIRNELFKKCWTKKDTLEFSPVHLYPCYPEETESQIWRYHPDTQRIIFPNSASCLDWNITTRAIFVTNGCSDSASQKWIVDDVNVERMSQWGKTPATHAPAHGRSYKVELVPSTKAMEIKLLDFKK